jgi:glycolate oxidase
MTNDIVAELQSIVGKDWVITNREQMLDYMSDAVMGAVIPKAAENIILVKPANAQHISEIMKLANKKMFPVIVRGGGSGMAGGAVPNVDCILLSLERMNRIIELSKEDLMITVEAGKPYGEMCQAVEAEGMFFAPRPGDLGAQCGGITATNAGGSRAVKYGVTRAFVKGMEVVTPTGEILHLGGKLLKYSMGLDLAHMFIGSKGELGIITQVTFRLAVKAPFTSLVLATYDDRLECMKVAPHVTASMIIPLAGEYIDHDLAIDTAKYLGLEWPDKNGKAHIFFVSEGPNEDVVYSELEKIAGICEEHGAINILMADRKEEQFAILQSRGETGSMQKASGNIGDFMDIAVPPSRVAELFAGILDLEKKYNTWIPTCGHASDGNLHPTPLKELADRGVLEDCKDDMYRKAIELGGVLTGEHGIGTIRLHNTSLWPEVQIWEYMKKVKQVFDPNNILNPHREIPD